MATQTSDNNIQIAESLYKEGFGKHDKGRYSQ